MDTDEEENALLEQLRVILNGIYDTAGSNDELFTALNAFIADTISENVHLCFICKVLDALDSYSFTEEMQNVLIEHLKTEFINDITVWEYLATRELKGAHRIQVVDEEEDQRQQQEAYMITNFQACIEVYNEGISRISEINKPELRKLFVEFLSFIQDQESMFWELRNLRFQQLDTTYTEMHEYDYLTENNYLTWIHLHNHTSALHIAELGTAAHPESVRLWDERLKLQKDHGERYRIFQLGIERLSEKAACLWNFMINHYWTSEIHFTEQLFKLGFQQPHPIVLLIKHRYLEWTYCVKGLESARNLYTEIANTEPLSQDLHDAMLRIELFQPIVSFFYCEHIHKNRCAQFGHRNYLFWISYLQFYVRHKGDVSNRRECIEHIFQEALQNVKEDEQLYLIEAYNHLRIVSRF